MKTIRISFTALLVWMLLFTQLGAGGSASTRVIAAPESCAGLFVSEYIEGTSYNKAIEIYNGTGGPVDLSVGPYKLEIYFNGTDTAGATIPLSGSIPPGDVFVVAHSTAASAIQAEADRFSNSLTFNGNDAVVLKQGSTVIDAIGQTGFDPGAEWGSGLASTFDNTLRRNAAVSQGDANGGDAFVPSLEWDGYAIDTFDGLGSHSADCGLGLPPTLTLTTPADGSSNVPLDSSLTVMFSEAVDVVNPWFGISCPTSGTHTETAAATTDAITFTLDPAEDFDYDETCTVTVRKEQVSDRDSGATPLHLSADYSFSFSTLPSQDPLPTVTGTTPLINATDIPLDVILTVNFSEAVNVQSNWLDLECGAGNLAGVYAPLSGPSTSFTFDPASRLPAGATCSATVDHTKVLDADTLPDPMSLDYSWSFTTVPVPGATRIRDIQGAAHLSPLKNTTVANVPGLITALTSKGFYLQDPSPDADDSTSEGIYVFLNTTPGVQVGDEVLVSGTAQEYRSSSDPSGLSVTEINTSSSSILKVTGGNHLPDPLVIGTNGRLPGGHIIEDDTDASRDVEAGGVFDPDQDWLDFYESLEGMRVQVNNALIVGPTNSYGEIPVVPDTGAHSGVITLRGGVLLQADNPNPERVILDDGVQATPKVDVGATFSQVVGVLDYNFSNYKLEVTQISSGGPPSAQAETTLTTGPHALTIATFNTENLDPGDADSHFNQIAHQIVRILHTPDILSLEEIQDNNGADKDAVVAADQTLSKLITAIQTAGGPIYAYSQIDPADDQDGGESGGNIRQAFLFNPARVQFVERDPGDAATATAAQASPAGPILTHSPGRIDPTNAAFNASRKPLAGEFIFNGVKLFVIANHFNSKGGDEPLFGRYQPPALSSEARRIYQAAIVHNFAASLLALDPGARVVVLGDLNDFTYSNPLLALKGAPQILFDLIETLPLNQQYTYIYDGNSQVLDHILVSQALAQPDDRSEVDVLHLNADLTDHNPLRTSDHDPVLAQLNGFYVLYLPGVWR